jgi:hypothetical protein
MSEKDVDDYSGYPLAIGMGLSVGLVLVLAYCTARFCTPTVEPCEPEAPSVSVAVIDEATRDLKGLTAKVDALTETYLDMTQLLGNAGQLCTERFDGVNSRISSIEATNAENGYWIDLLLTARQPANTVAVGTTPTPNPTSKSKEFDDVTITANTTDSCPPCEVFKKVDKPQLEALGAKIVVVPTPNNPPFPWFTIKIKNQVLPTHRGSLSVATLRRLLPRK